MADRLSSADLAFLDLDTPSTPQHVGSVAILDAPGGFDYGRLVRLIEERISMVPRYRQKVRAVPRHLANPVWVDDPGFDLTYHVRRSALPRPGTHGALLEFAARILERPLDRDRPLWEMYLVEGLAGDRVAIVTKTHPSMVDGHRGVDIAEVLLDESVRPRRTVAPLWMPEPEPGRARLVADAVLDAARRPAALADTVRLSVRDARAMLGWVADAAGGVGASLGGVLARGDVTPPDSPLRAEPGQHRRIAVARTELGALRSVRARRGGTVHDVVVAVVAGALRGWLLSRDQPLSRSAGVRALVPISLAGGDVPPRGWSPSSRVVGSLVDLPVGEPDPLRRLMQVQYATAAQLTSGRPVSAGMLADLAGFAPPTLHSLGARAARGLTRRLYSVAVINVPGPQRPRYAAGARLSEVFPVLPLNAGQALSIGVTSYAGGVFFGVNGDRDAVPDVTLIADLLGAALDELVRAAPATRTRTGGRARARSAGRSTRQGRR